MALWHFSRPTLSAICFGSLVTVANFLSAVRHNKFNQRSKHFFSPDNTCRALQINSTNPKFLPRNSHVTISSSQLKPNVLFIGDVHGCKQELDRLLSAYGYEKKKENTTLIFVGDLVNKGPASMEVLRFVKNTKSLCVRGNHEQSALAVALGLKPMKAGREWTNSLNFDDVAWLRQLPYTITIPSMNIKVVHAGLVPGLPTEEQPLKDILTMRNLIQEQDQTMEVERKLRKETNLTTPPNQEHDIKTSQSVQCRHFSEDQISGQCCIRWKPSESVDEGVAWASEWKGPEKIVFGHDAMRRLQQWLVSNLV